MSDQSKVTPQSPEVQKEYVREELEQDEITHKGDKREAPDKESAHSELSNASRHLGAVDDEVVPVVPPMSGPADLVGEQDENAQGNESGKSDDEELFDPYDHMTPG